MVVEDVYSAGKAKKAKDLPCMYLIWVAKMSATLKRKELMRVPFHLQEGRTHNRSVVSHASLGCMTRAKGQAEADEASSATVAGLGHLIGWIEKTRRFSPTNISPAMTQRRR